ncbi:response regulator [Desulfohalobiaceae bacterium Ax17]|uniref:response regulator n=1 Tax=Desulfovulcanus ferrireducens TaxID=2831190 RepID=UPI00207BB102|nr:response regulator [Desulfovulcanus ferrireducens]MBT8762773.1 response regulator [Desulfovulcanus ferrireducens]
MSHEKVLLVDDEQEFLSALSERMKNRGLEVATATSGKEALEKIGQESYDAVILDMLMPDMDGLETLKSIKATNPELQIILLTGHATVKSGIEAMKLGALDFIEKPADIKELMEKIKEAKSKKMLLIEKKNTEKLKEILMEKGW